MGWVAATVGVGYQRAGVRGNIGVHSGGVFNL